MSITGIQNIFLFFLLSKLVTEIYLLLRNRSRSNRICSVPEIFENAVSQDSFKQSRNYTIAKSNLSLFSLPYEALLCLYWTVGGGISSLSIFIKSFALPVLAEATIVFLIFQLVQGLLSLPIQIYSTFVIEQKFGFNQTTFKLFIIDLIKGSILGILIGGPIIYGLFALLYLSGSNWWIFAAFALIAVQLLLLFIYPTILAPIFNKFSPLSDEELKAELIKLLDRIGFKSNSLKVMDASKRTKHGNAYFTGFGKNKQIVLFDTLISKLNHQEILAVLAHELGHFKLKHVLKSLLTSTIALFVLFYILGKSMENKSLFEAHGLFQFENYSALIIFLLVTPIYTFFLTPILSRRSRKHEYQADSFAAKYTTANDLKEALLKLHIDNAGNLIPDKWFVSFYYSHPPLEQRIEALSAPLQN